MNSLINLPCYKNATKIRSKIAYKTLEHFIPKEHCLYFVKLPELKEILESSFEIPLVERRTALCIDI